MEFKYFTHYKLSENYKKLNQLYRKYGFNFAMNGVDCSCAGNNRFTVFASYFELVGDIDDFENGDCGYISLYNKIDGKFVPVAQLYWENKGESLKGRKSVVTKKSTIRKTSTKPVSHKVKRA